MQTYLPTKKFKEEVEYADSFLFLNGHGKHSEERIGLMCWLYDNLQEPEKPSTKEEIPRYLWELADKIEYDRKDYLNPDWMKYIDGIAAFAGTLGAGRVMSSLPPELSWIDLVLAAAASSPFWVRQIRKSQYKKKFPKLDEAFHKGVASYCHALKDVYERGLSLQDLTNKRPYAKVA